MSYEFFVEGKPVPQGSMSGFVSATTGRIVMPQKPAVRAWRGLIAAAAKSATRNRKVMMGGPKRVVLTFYLEPPKKPPHERPIGRVGDLDKLVRSCLDALTGVLFDDDSQVCEIAAYKAYSGGMAAGVHVSVSDL